ncbi:hypothetical protein J7T55_001105 [Diaporthe amygdali]|uniref:uncharacterized protein n=1 Tax=Phomopsis amygdali TaxID=1214568 RepID=UPI0022FEA9DA|nr:uncharacterized protein J7T55_001105 [Diaporthe amygdali]KAJ0120248.1 hypothetical protein J7T55_001105 [Diaporthe amygdali]
MFGIRSSPDLHQHLQLRLRLRLPLVLHLGSSSPARLGLQQGNAKHPQPGGERSHAAKRKQTDYMTVSRLIV